MKIGISGCSHSGGAYGKPWHYFVSKNLNSDIIDITSSGAGNEISIEKIKHVLENTTDLDFFICQITEPTRLDFGLCGNDIEEEFKLFYNIPYDPNSLNSHRDFKGINYYTFNLNDENNNFLNKIINSKYEIQDFMNNHILISDFNVRIKVFHTLMTIQHLCDLFNKKVLFFSWYVDIKKLAKESGYSEIIKNINIIDGNVVEFCDDNNLDEYKVDNIHYNSEGHEKIYNGYIKPALNNFLEKYNLI
jgi:hypothetical protein